MPRDKFEWVLQKCTEVGVGRFVPMITERSVVRDGESVAGGKLERWRRILTEAAEQSGRGRVPELAAPVESDKGMAELEGFARSLIASTEAQDSGLENCLRGCSRIGGVSIALFVGPEGGFTEDELERGRASGAIPFSLGERILRTETAAVVASSLILYELGEMGS